MELSFFKGYLDFICNMKTKRNSLKKYAVQKQFSPLQVKFKVSWKNIYISGDILPCFVVIGGFLSTLTHGPANHKNYCCGGQPLWMLDFYYLLLLLKVCEFVSLLVANMVYRKIRYIIIKKGLLVLKKVVFGSMLLLLPTLLLIHQI